jgi:hypothetical protein
VALNTTTLAHRDAVWGGRQPSHLLALDERFDVGWRDKTSLVAQLGDPAAPEMSAAAGFHRNDASWKLAKEHKNLRPSQCLTQHRSTCAVSSVNLKHIFRQIESDCDNLRHDRSPL